METALKIAKDEQNEMAHRKIEPLLYELSATVRNAIAQVPLPQSEEFKYLPEVASNMIERHLGRERAKYNLILENHKKKSKKFTPELKTDIMAQCARTQIDLHEAFAAYKDKAKSPGATKPNDDSYQILAKMSLDEKKIMFRRKVSYRRFLYELDTGMHSLLAAMSDRMRAYFAKLKELRALIFNVNNNMHIDKMQVLNKIWPLVLADFTIVQA